MAPKQNRPSPLDDPPSDSDEDQGPSSQQRPNDHEEEENDEEETSSEEEEDDEDDDDDEEEHQPAPKNPQPQQPANSRPKPSSSESESDSATESDSEPDLPPPKVKSLAPTTKPKEQTPKSKPLPSSSAMQAKSASKRPAENNGHSSSEAKRAKKKVASSSAAAASSSDEDAKKPSSEKKLFQRVFSEEDEIAILKGLVEFSSKMKGTDPLKNPEAFHDFLKGSKSLGFDASCKQLKQKVARLKKKFENNAGRGKNGKDPSFSKPHEQKSFELSKKIWSNIEEASNEKSFSATLEKKSSNSKSPAKQKLSLTESKEIEKTDEKIETSLVASSMMRFDKAVSLCGLGEDLVRAGVDLIEPSKRAELEGKWRELQEAELALCARRAQLIAEQYKLVVQAKKSSKN